MNSLVKNKKRALRAATRLGHTMGRFYIVGGYALSRCTTCGGMLYVAGKRRSHLYRKIISGDTLKGSCADVAKNVKL